MKILYIISNYHPYADANTNCLEPFIHCMKGKADIYVLTKSRNNSDKVYETDSNGKVYRFQSTCMGKFTSKFIHGRVGLRIHRNVREMLFGLLSVLMLMLLSPVIFFIKLFTGTIVYDDEWAAANAVKKIVTEENIDVVVSSSAPSYPHYACLHLAKNGFFAKHRVKWFAYFMDPSATYAFVPESKRNAKLKREKEIYQYAQMVFVPPEMYAENTEKYFNEYKDKMVSLPFPNLIPEASEKQKAGHPSGFIECAYIGTLSYSQMRDVTALIDFIEKLDDERFRINLIGNIPDSVLAKLQQRKTKATVKIHGRLPLDVCKEYMAQCDVLINIGNNCFNQMPSKVFDYISTGNMILNFSKFEKDPSRTYLRMYPLCYEITGTACSDEVIRDFLNFYENNCGKRIKAEEIRNLYGDFCYQNVVGKFEKVLTNEENK